MRPKRGGCCTPSRNYRSLGRDCCRASHWDLVYRLKRSGGCAPAWNLVRLVRSSRRTSARSCRSLTRSGGRASARYLATVVLRMRTILVDQSIVGFRRSRGTALRSGGYRRSCDLWRTRGTAVWRLERRCGCCQCERRVEGKVTSGCCGSGTLLMRLLLLKGLWHPWLHLEALNLGLRCMT
jgi:hypothetical protein